MTDLTGQLIKGYKISKEIGQGKFSIVYRAENEMGKPFALKKIKVRIPRCRYLTWQIKTREINA